MAAELRVAMRQRTQASRSDHRQQGLSQRRFGDDAPDEPHRGLSVGQLVSRLSTCHFSDLDLLCALKQSLSEPDVNPDEFFAADPAAVHGLVAVLTSPAAGPAAQLSATQVIANLAPIKEKNGLILARAAGPYLITLLSSGSKQVQEAAGVALGNLALAGLKVVKVLLNQEALDSLGAVLGSSAESVQSASYYALYHILHALDGSVAEPKPLCDVCLAAMEPKAPVELFWVLFALSGCPQTHQYLVTDAAVAKALDVCTYEIFQKSDSRPLVKIVTPLVRYLANVSAGPQGEAAILSSLRHPDLPAILMALLGTNYMHLCKETLWWFSNMTNSDSVVVQEELIELDLMDKMEYLTVQAVQKVDPYLTNVI